ncbi:MAG: hypothetical protein AAGF94_13270 [Pseudomonadota bacterium]
MQKSRSPMGEGDLVTFHIAAKVMVFLEPMRELPCWVIILLLLTRDRVDPLCRWC